MSATGNEDFQLVEIGPEDGEWNPSAYGTTYGRREDGYRRGAYGKRGYDQRRYKGPRWARKGTPNEEDENESKQANRERAQRYQENARQFVGEWKDSLGHSIIVFEPLRQHPNMAQKFAVLLCRPGSPEKALGIRCDQNDRWQCGNGYLDLEKTTLDYIVWETNDGRISEWTRLPPNGPVFFDPPPFLIEQAPALGIHIRTEKILPKLVETSEYCHVDAESGHLIWRLPDEWKRLKKFPENYCITSPSFEAPNVKAMQIVFYPTGLDVSENRVSTISLQREGPGAGLRTVKFEFHLNGKSLGAKVCAGHRIDVSVERPADETTEVVISLALLQIGAK